MSICLFGTGISYVYIECIPKTCVRDNLSVSDCKKDIVCGMFAGLNEDKHAGVSTKYILIHDTEVDTRLSLNRSIYNVVCVDKCTSTGKRFFTFYSSSDKDQEKAIKHLNVILGVLKSQDKCFMNRDEVIVSRYTNIPASLYPNKAPKKDKDTTNDKEKIVPFMQQRDTRNYSEYGCRGASTYKVPDKPKALFFRRKDEKPSLGQMKLWVKQVMKKEYKEPEIPEIKVKEVTTTDPCNRCYRGFDEDYANGMYGY